MRYFGRYFANPRCEKPVKNWLLCVARENLRLKNSDIYTKIWLSAPKITKTRKLKTCFPSIVSICVHHGHKNKQKLTKTVCFSSLYIRDLNLPPIRFVQFVPQFIPRCRLYSFIISMIKITHFLRNNLGTILPKNTRAIKKKLLRSSWPNSLHFMPSVTSND